MISENNNGPQINPSHQLPSWRGLTKFPANKRTSPAISWASRRCQGFSNVDLLRKMSYLYWAIVGDSHDYNWWFKTGSSSRNAEIYIYNAIYPFNGAYFYQLLSAFGNKTSFKLLHRSTCLLSWPKGFATQNESSIGIQAFISAIRVGRGWMSQFGWYDWGDWQSLGQWGPRTTLLPPSI